LRVVVPLARTKRIRPSKFEELLGAPNQGRDLQAQALTQTLGIKDKTLFILDGLDEVIGELDEKTAL